MRVRTAQSELRPTSLVASAISWIKWEANRFSRLKCARILTGRRKRRNLDAGLSGTG